MFDFIRSYLNCSRLCVCFTTKRLLFNVSHEMLQRLTIIEEAISFNLQCACFATIINILYKHVCFRPLWPWILLHRYFFLCSIFSRINEVYWSASDTGDIYIYPFWVAWAFVLWHVWLHQSHSSNRIGALSVVRSRDHSRDSISLPYNTRLYCTKHIARLNLYASNKGRFGSCEFRRNTFSYSIILTKVYDPNLKFSIFCRFCS